MTVYRPQWYRLLRLDYIQCAYEVAHPCIDDEGRAQWVAHFQGHVDAFRPLLDHPEWTRDRANRWVHREYRRVLAEWAVSPFDKLISEHFYGQACALGSNWSQIKQGCLVGYRVRLTPDEAAWWDAVKEVDDV